MTVDTHLMALMSSLHGAIVFFAGCFFGFRMGRKSGPETAKPAQEVQQ
jgi:hypothetical protein